MITMRISNGPIDEKIVLKYEKKWKITLPNDYKNFLIEFNGGRSVLDSFNFLEREDGSDIHSFFGIHDNENANLKKYVKTYKKRIPKELFPIANDSGGNLICIGIKDDYYGKIYFWDHEKEKKKPDFSNVEFVSNSFTEFVNSLYEFQL